VLEVSTRRSASLIFRPIFGLVYFGVIVTLLGRLAAGFLASATASAPGAEA